MTVDQTRLTATLRELTTAFAANAQARVSPYLSAVVTHAASLLRAECVGVALLDEADHIRPVVATGPAARAFGLAQEQLGHSASVPALPLRPFVVDDLLEHPEYADIIEHVQGNGVRAVVSAPVIAIDVIGNLTMIQTHPHHWSGDTVAGAQAFADLVGAALVMSARRGQSYPDEKEEP